MKYLCCLQLAIGLAAMSAGLAGIIMWTQTFLAYLPAVGAGIMVSFEREIQNQFTNEQLRFSMKSMMKSFE